MSRTCPDCEASHVVSVREWKAVYKWRTHLKRDAPRIVGTLSNHGWEPNPSEDRTAMARRWADDDRHETNPSDDSTPARPSPGYICAACRRVHLGREVSGR
jgi:hypothetical protein